MRRILRFLRLPLADQCFLIKVMLLVWAVRIMLWLLPFRKVRDLLTRFSGTAGSELTGAQSAIDRIAWAVTAGSHFVPAATCLTQALATKILLRRCGYHASVHIGVTRTDAGKLQAHAWVESNGKIVIGGSEASLKRFTLLAAANGELW